MSSGNSISSIFRRCAAILSVCALLLGVTACGGDAAADTAPAGSGAEATASEQPAEAEADSGDAYNVVLEWFSIANTPSEENLRKIEAAVNEITLPAIGVTVTLYPVNFSNRESDTTLAISSGEKVDLVCSVSTGVGSLVNAGLIIPMDDLVEQHGGTARQVLGDALLGGYYGNTLYGVPNAYILSETYGYNARTDLLEKYGVTIDPDKRYSMEELGEIFATVKEGEGDGFYCVAGPSSDSDLFNQFWGTVDALGATPAAGGLLMENNWSNTTIENIYASAQYEAYARQMYDWAQKGYIAADAASNTDDSATLIAGGNYLGRIHWTTGSAASDFQQQTGYECTLIEMFAPYKKTSQFNNILWSIPITSERPDKAMEFLDLMYADNDIDSILMFGLEGETYQILEQDDKGNRVVDFVDGLDASTAPYYCYAGVYGDRLSWLIWVPNPITFNDDLRAFNQSVNLESPALGYCFEITDNISSKYSAVSSVVKQYTGMVDAGALSPEESLPAFNKALEDAGIADVIAENQRQLDEWLASR